MRARQTTEAREPRRRKYDRSGRIEPHVERRRFLKGEPAPALELVRPETQIEENSGCLLETARPRHASDDREVLVHEFYAPPKGRENGARYRERRLVQIQPE